jgi:hypothetical protein
MTTTMMSTPGRRAPARPHRRAGAGTIRLTQRDIDGLVLCAEHGGAPYDLLAAALAVTPDRLRAIVARWRRAGYAATGRPQHPPQPPQSLHGRNPGPAGPRPRTRPVGDPHLRMAGD